MSRPTSDLKRRTSSATSHRRPFWAKNEKSLKLYIDNPRGATHSPKAGDYGVDNFSYDEDHCKQFAMPDGLAERLPDTLREKAEDWQKAGAALCTALDRTHASYKNALYSAYPDKTRSPRPPRNDQQQAGSGADISPMDSPISHTPLSPTPISPATVAKLEKLSLSMPSSQAQTPVGMASPPDTPLETKACATPVGLRPVNGTRAEVLPDLLAPNSELSPLSSFSSVDSSALVTPPGFDDVSWEHFLKKFEEEILDNKHALSRVRGFGRSIDVLLVELGASKEPEVRLPIMHFTEWWEGMKPKVRQLEQRVKGLDTPKLDYVTFEYEMARAEHHGVAHSAVLDSAAA